jgi:hypothetical protein
MPLIVSFEALPILPADTLDPQRWFRYHANPHVLWRGRSPDSEVRMIRIAIRAWAFCFTSLTILPGCQMLSPFGGSSAGVANDERTPAPPREKQDAGAGSRESHQANSNAKPNNADQAPINSRGPLIEPLPLESMQKQPVKADTTSSLKADERGMGTEMTGAKAVLPALPKAVDPIQDKREFAPLVNALQCFLDSEHEKAIEHLSVYDKRTQEFLIGLLPTMNIFVRKRLDEMSVQEVAVLNNQLLSLLATLRPRSELTIDKMCYCKKVRGFGAYDMLPSNHVFLSATKDRPGELVQLYVELKNFASEAGSDGEFVTRLVCSLDLQNAKGDKVYSHTYDRKETTDRRRTRLNDFFGNYNFYVPELAPGDYKLTIRVVDETVPGSQRQVSRSMSFRVTPVLNQTLR